MLNIDTSNNNNSQSYLDVYSNKKIPDELIYAIFKNCGVSLLNLSCTSKTYQEMLEKIPALKALKLLKQAYKLKKYQVLAEIVSALTLIDPDEALKIADSLDRIVEVRTYKCGA